MVALDSHNPGFTAGADSSAVLTSWIDEHTEYLLAYCRKYFHADDVAEDLVQETFLAACEGFDRFQGKSAARTWLVGILRHKIFDRIRKSSREQPVDFEALEQDPIRHLFDEHEHWRAETGPLMWNTSPEKVFENKQFLAAFQRCLAKLPSRFREIFVLRELDELSREEIAAQLEITGNHVGVLLFRARAELQECLQKNWLKPQRAGG